MRHQCHIGKWSEDAVRAKQLRKHETTRWKNGETYQSLVRAPRREKYFKRFKARLEGCYKGGHSGKNYHQEERSEHDLNSRKDQNKIMMFYLKAYRYDPEGKQALTNLPEKKT